MDMEKVVKIPENRNEARTALTQAMYVLGWSEFLEWLQQEAHSEWGTNNEVSHYLERAQSEIDRKTEHLLGTR